MQVKGRHREVKYSNRRGNFNLEYVKSGVLGANSEGTQPNKEQL